MIPEISLRTMQRLGIDKPLYQKLNFNFGLPFVQKFFGDAKTNISDRLQSLSHMRSIIKQSDIHPEQLSQFLEVVKEVQSNLQANKNADISLVQNLFTSLLTVGTKKDHSPSLIDYWTTKFTKNDWLTQQLKNYSKTRGPELNKQSYLRSQDVIPPSGINPNATITENLTKNVSDWYNQNIQGGTTDAVLQTIANPFINTYKAGVQFFETAKDIGRMAGGPAKFMKGQYLEGINDTVRGGLGTMTGIPQLLLSGASVVGSALPILVGVGGLGYLYKKYKNSKTYKAVKDKNAAEQAWQLTKQLSAKTAQQVGNKAAQAYNLTQPLRKKIGQNVSNNIDVVRDAAYNGIDRAGKGIASHNRRFLQQVGDGISKNANNYGQRINGYVARIGNQALKVNNDVLNYAQGGFNDAWQNIRNPKPDDPWQAIRDPKHNEAWQLIRNTKKQQNIKDNKQQLVFLNKTPKNPPHNKLNMIAQKKKPFNQITYVDDEGYQWTVPVDPNDFSYKKYLKWRQRFDARQAEAQNKRKLQNSQDQSQIDKMLRQLKQVQQLQKLNKAKQSLFAHYKRKPISKVKKQYDSSLQSKWGKNRLRNIQNGEKRQFEYPEIRARNSKRGVGSFLRVQDTQNARLKDLSQFGRKHSGWQY